MHRTTHGPAKRLAAALATLAMAVAVPVVAAPAAQAASPTSLILELTNDYRASKGLPKLSANSGVAKVAQSWSEKMLAARSMSHNPRFSEQIPSGWTAAAENVGYACGYSSAESAAKAIMEAWKKSSGHDANLRGKYTDLGVGFAWDSGSRCAYTTQNFATYPGGGSTGFFDDVASSSQSRYFSAFFDEIEWMASEGITTGWKVSGGREYRPLSRVTREAMAAFMYRMDGSPSGGSSTSFTDTSSSPFSDEIAWLAGEGITTGWDNGDGTADFRPDAQITRDAMAAFLYRYAGEPSYKAPSSSPFADVSPSSPFYKEICWLASTGISTGWSVSGGKKEYRPLSPITRDAMAAFLARFDAKGF